jgi:hypothetical protein
MQFYDPLLEVSQAEQVSAELDRGTDYRGFLKALRLPLLFLGQVRKS